jgi:hypothetical protein
MVNTTTAPKATAPGSACTVLSSPNCTAAVRIETTNISILDQRAARGAGGNAEREALGATPEARTDAVVH